MSQQARDLLQKIIVKEPTCRLPLTQIIGHPWIVNMTGKRPEQDVPAVDTFSFFNIWFRNVAVGVLLLLDFKPPSKKILFLLQRLLFLWLVFLYPIGVMWMFLVSHVQPATCALPGASEATDIFLLEYINELVWMNYSIYRTSSCCQMWAHLLEMFRSFKCAMERGGSKPVRTFLFFF